MQSYRIWPITLLIAIFLLLGALHALWSPIFIKPDEAWHMGYVEYLRRDGGLPSVRLNLPSGETRGRAEPEGHQPPLYYAAVALATLPIDLSDSDNLYRRNPHFLATEGGNLNVWAPTPSRAETAFYVGRFVSLLFGAVAVAATYGAALEFLPWGVALMAAAALAFNPQFLVISTSLSNDVPAVAWCSLALWAALRSMRRGLTMRRAAAFGLAVGLGTLTKLSGLLPIALLPLMVVFSSPLARPSPPFAAVALRTDANGRSPLARKGRGGKDRSPSNEQGGSSDSLSLWERVGVRVSVPPRASKTLTQPLPQGEEPDLSSPSPIGGRGGRGVRGRLPAALLALALALLLPLPWFIRNRQLYGDFLATSPVFALMGQRPGLIPPADLAALLLFIGRSYWLDVGPGGVGFGPAWLYLALAALVVVCGAGVVVAWRRRPDWRPFIAALVWYALIVLASVLSLGTRTRTFMGGGRLAFPFAGAVAILLALGAWSLVPKQWARALVVGWSGAWLGLAAAVTWLFVAAPFAPPPVVAATAAPPTATFDGGFVLRDAQIGGVDGAGNASVALDWEVTAPPDRLYSVFVQALNPAGPGLLAQVDTLPGRGYFPWERWTPGEARRDTYTLALPPVDEPQRVPVVAGLYDAATMQRLTATQDGRAADAVVVGNIVLRPTSPLSVPEAARLPQPVTFGAARLVGAEVAPDGQTLGVTLWWQADGPLPADYTVFVHLLGANGLAATGDGPAGGRFPTSAWAAGDVVRDEHRLALDQVAPGGYRVGVGLYDAATGARVAAAQSGAPLPDDTAIVGEVTR
ncbi:MAG: glycosyltransferase family 39 protein [Anaerolineae bacterium]